MLATYIMKPKAGCVHLAAAARGARQSSASNTDGFTDSAMVYYIDPNGYEMKIAYPTLLFDRDVTDDRNKMHAFLSSAVGHNQGSWLRVL